MDPSPPRTAVPPRPSARRRQPHSLRLLERSLRAAGCVALAWVSMGWLDARLYQAQQERLFAESMGVAQLEQRAAAIDAAAGEAAGAAGAHGRDSAVEARGGAGVTGPLAGTRVEIEGDGPARIIGPPAARRAGAAEVAAPAAAAVRGATPPMTAAAPASQPARLPQTPVRTLPGDEGWSGRSASTGAALGRLTVPRLGMGVMVAPGIDARSLRRAAGHIPGTAVPGDDGNVGIAGHRDTFFRPLRRIVTGDEIVLTTAQGTARYTVEWTRVVAPDAVDVLAPTAYGALTLVTCYPFHYVGHAPERFIVRARLMEREGQAAASQTAGQ